jgi:hypothetical protein
MSHGAPWPGSCSGTRGETSFEVPGRQFSGPGRRTSQWSALRLVLGSVSLLLDSLQDGWRHLRRGIPGELSREYPMSYKQTYKSNGMNISRYSFLISFLPTVIHVNQRRRAQVGDTRWISRFKLLLRAPQDWKRTDQKARIPEWVNQIDSAI